MKKAQFTKDQAMAAVQAHRAGTAVKEICRRHGITEATFRRWIARFGAEPSCAKRLDRLEDDQRWLKKQLADTLLTVAALKAELSRGGQAPPVPATAPGGGRIGVSRRRSATTRRCPAPE